MLCKKIKVLLLILLGLGFLEAHAQEVILTSGGNTSGSDGSVSYSIGQIVYMSHTGTNGSILQGVQLPYEISTVTGLEETNVSLKCTVYPNPASNYVVLKIRNYEANKLSFQLYDLNGRLLENKKIKNNETTIPLEKLLPSVYFLKVSDNSNIIKTFKIVKN